MYTLCLIMVMSVGLQAKAQSTHPIIRGVNAAGDHIFASATAPIVNGGYAVEGPAFTVFNTFVAGDASLFRCTLPSGLTFTSTDPACESSTTIPPKFIGFIASDVVYSGLVGLYRYRNANGDHMTTRGKRPNLQALGYQLDGLLGYVP